MNIEAPVGMETWKEAEFQRAVVVAAFMNGWVVSHFPQMMGNPPGFPDLLLLKGDRYLLFELKREKGKERPRQILWREEAERYGVTVHLLKPSDWERMMEMLEAS